MAKTKHTAVAAEHKIEEFAEDLGRLLGTARAKAEGWLGQRHAVVKNLTELRDTATKLLVDLGHEADSMLPGSSLAGRRRGGQARGGSITVLGPLGTVKKKRTMSAAARAKIGAAQKRRWAALKATEKKK